MEQLDQIETFTTYFSLILLAVISVVVLYSLWEHQNYSRLKPQQGGHHYQEGLIGQWSWVMVPMVVLLVDLSFTDAAHKSTQSVISDHTRSILTQPLEISHHQEFDYLLEQPTIKSGACNPPVIVSRLSQVSETKTIKTTDCLWRTVFQWATFTHHFSET